MENREDIYLEAIKSALEAGKAVMEVYSEDFDTEFKQDGSPITMADRKANDIICNALKKTGIMIISEESPKEDFRVRSKEKLVWMVDPVDGTKEFTSRNGEFTVNIALIENQQPVFGVVTAPAINQGYFGWIGKGAFKTDSLSDLLENIESLQLKDILDVAFPIKPRVDEQQPAFAISRSHLTEGTKQLITKLSVGNSNIKTISKGSSLKFCLLAEGVVQYYAREDLINEWDTAAGHALLLAAGGALITIPDGKAMLYNKESLKTPGFVAFADPSLLSAVKQNLSL